MTKTTKQMRSAARLYAVQALFQMEASDQTMDEVADQFRSHRFGAIVDGEEFSEADVDLFDSLIVKAVQEQSKIDQATNAALAENWPINRIDPTLRALFRAAGAEFVKGATPFKVVISEFVDVARAFFPDGKEPKFVNAVLDAMYKHIRETG